MKQENGTIINLEKSQAPTPGAMLHVLVVPGRFIFATAIAALGVETLVCAGRSEPALGPQLHEIPVIPWLPAVPWLGYVFGAVLICCGAGIVTRRWRRDAGWVVAALLTICTLILIVPKYVAEPGSMSLRTVVFEPLTLAGMALLIDDMRGRRGVAGGASAALIAVSLIVFGVDHLLDVPGIASLLPHWIPWHAFWVAFFGLAFIAAGLSFGFGRLLSWAMAGNGLMLGIWVLTLHLPRVLGLYGVPGAPRSPDEWSSLLIAAGLWGGSWALVDVPWREVVP